MTGEEAKKIWEAIKENGRKLDSCSGHDFSIDLTPGKPYDKRWKCTACGGEVNSVNKHWYERGIAHASRREG